MKKLFNLLRHLTPVFEYVGNMNQIHWSSWTATADGAIIMDIGWVTGGGSGYYYVKDITANREIAKMTTSSANGTSETRCFPVIKGHTYQVSAQAKADGSHLNFFFYKLKLFGGGYGITSFMSTVLSAISSFVRRWSHEQGIKEYTAVHCEPHQHEGAEQRRPAEASSLDGKRVVQLAGRDGHLVCVRKCDSIANIGNGCIWDAASNEKSVQCASADKSGGIYSTIHKLQREGIFESVRQRFVVGLGDSVTLERGCC